MLDREGNRAALVRGVKKKKRECCIFKLLATSRSTRSVNNFDGRTLRALSYKDENKIEPQIDLIRQTYLQSRANSNRFLLVIFQGFLITSYRPDYRQLVKA